MSSEPLVVFLAGEQAGSLERESTGQLCFRYSSRWLESPARHAISYSLPLTGEPYRGWAVRGFFEGLLPGSESRAAICEKRGIDPDDLLGLLGALAGDCPGAVSVAAGADRQKGYLEISRAQLREMAAAPPVLPQLSGAGGIRLTLAGSRDKLPVYLDGNRIYLPVGRSPSSHLLKFGPRETLANEVLTNQVALGLGLAVPEMVMVSMGPCAMLVIKRFDRALDQNGKLQRRHQEDLRQALGAGRDQGHQLESEPSLASCFEVLAAASLEPALDLEAVLRWRLFNLLLDSPDRRAADLSLTGSGRGLRLAPFCGLRMGTGEAQLEAGALRALARHVGVKERYLKNMLAEMSGRLEEVRAEAVREFEQRYGESSVAGEWARRGG